MTKAQRLYSLVRAHDSGDKDRFYSVVETIAFEAGASGNRSVQEHLQSLVKDGREKAQRGRGATLALPQTMTGKVDTVTDGRRLCDVSLPKETEARLRQVVTERRARDRLLSFDLVPISRVLMAGPPGTGKTLSAALLANEIEMPLYVVRMDAMVASHMGETASNLRRVFDAAATHPGVWFFDEIDAITGSRANANDIGEARRVVNSLLQMMEADVGRSLLVAATNLREAMDPAILRRFDFEIEFHMPDEIVLSGIVRRTFAAFETEGFDWQALGKAALGLSPSECTLRCRSVAKDAVINADGALCEKVLLAELSRRVRTEPRTPHAADVEKPAAVAA